MLFMSFVVEEPARFTMKPMKSMKKSLTL